MNKKFSKNISYSKIQKRMKPKMQDLNRFLVHRSEIDIPEIKPINAKKNNKPKKKPNIKISSEEKEYLKSILEHPNLSITARGRTIFGYSNDKNNRIKKSVLSKKLADEFSVDLGPAFGGRVKFLRLTNFGYKVLNEKVPKNTSHKRESLEHLWWKQQICRDYKIRGYKAIIEYNLNGKSADVAVFKDKDKVAVEVELSPKNAVTNFRKNIEAGYTRTIIACKNSRIKKEIEKNITAFIEHNPNYQSKFKIILLNEFSFVKNLYKEIRG